MIVHRIVAALAVVLGAGVAAAQTGPQLLTVFPPGSEGRRDGRGHVLRRGLRRRRDAALQREGLQSRARRRATVDPKTPKGKQPNAAPTAAVKFKVTAPKEALGTTDVRVVSKSGISNPRAFVVGNLAEVNENEPNNDVGQAQKIALETTVNGVISAPTDVDYVTFHAKAGQNVVVYCLTTSIDSKLSADIMAATPRRQTTRREPRLSRRRRGPRLQGPGRWRLPRTRRAVRVHDRRHRSLLPADGDDEGMGGCSLPTARRQWLFDHPGHSGTACDERH